MRDLVPLLKLKQKFFKKNYYGIEDVVKLLVATLDLFSVIILKKYAPSPVL